MATETEVLGIKADLFDAGYKCDGSDESWCRALRRYSRYQLKTAVDGLLENHRFKSVLPAHLIEQIQKETFHGEGRKQSMDPKGWQFWKEPRVVGKDKDGNPIEVMYEYAYHPSMPSYCKGKNQ